MGIRIPGNEFRVELGMVYSAEVQKVHDRTLERVKKMWGKASECQCVLCFDLARHWSFLWRTHDPSDPEGFVPMCAQDHSDYDLNSERTRKRWEDPEYRARMSAQSRELWKDPAYITKVERRNSPEYRARMSDQKRKLWEDPEYRARMTEVLRQKCSARVKKVSVDKEGRR